MNGVFERAFHLVQLLVLAQLFLLSLERGQSIVDVLQEFGDLFSFAFRVLENASGFFLALVVNASAGHLPEQFETS